MISHYHKLIYLLPIALITGPFLADLIVVLCSALFLIDTFRLKLFNYYNNSFFKIFLLFLLLINLSSIFSDYLISFKYSISYLRYGIFVIFIFYVLKNYDNSKFFLSYVIITTFVLLIIDGFIQFIFGKNILLFEIQEYREGFSYVTSFFNEEKKLGSFLSRMFPLLLISFIFIKEKYQNVEMEIFFSIIILLTFILILLTTERVSAAIISIFLIIIFMKSNFFLKPKKLFGITIILLTTITFYNYPDLLNKFKSILYSTGILFPGYTFTHTLESGAPGTPMSIYGEYEAGLFLFSKFHHDQIINSIKIFLENPIFGIGAKNYKNFTLIGWHPHNYHAQVLAELGIFSYLIIFSLFIFIFTSAGKKIFLSLNLKDEINFYLLITFLLNLMPIPSGDFFNNWVNILIFLPIGYYLYINE